MAFEGMEIEWAHVKLVPVWERKEMGENEEGEEGWKGEERGEGEFYETYQGFITSRKGPRVEDEESLKREAAHLRAVLERELQPIEEG